MIKQFGGSGYESSEIMVIDEVEMQRHHQLDKLYRSTRSGRVIIMSSYSSSKNVVYNLGTNVLDIEGIL